MNKLYPWIVASVACILFSGLMFQCQSPEKTSNFPDIEEFLRPDAKYRGYAGVQIRLASDNEQICRERIRHFHERGFGGVFIESTQGNSGDLPEWYVKQAGPFQKFQDEGMVYLDEEHMKIYRAMVEEADSLGMRVLLYDDYHFPTGHIEDVRS